MSEEGASGAADGAKETSATISGGVHHHHHRSPASSSSATGLAEVELTAEMSSAAAAVASSDEGFGPARQEQRWREQVLRALQRDILACDIQVSLFVAATNSYRHDSILSPFPLTLFDKEDGVDYLRETLQSLSDLKTLRSRLTNGLTVPLQLLRLVHWILLENPMGLRLSSVVDDVDAVLKLPCYSNEAPSHGTEAPAPTHVFKVENSKSQKWEEAYLGENCKTHFGFHGSRTDNFHSILSKGLQQHLTTNALFGEGIYLSTELGMSLTYSKIGQAWDRSLIGDQMSCVLLCEVLDHKDVKLHTEDPDRNYVSGSEGGKVPEKYLIVRNNDLLRNRYLLVFAKQQRSQPQKRRAYIPSWIWEHKFVLILIGYALMLVAVGVTNSPTVKRMLRRRGFLSDD